MARSHGRIMASIWTDPDFVALPTAPQRLYLFLLSQPDLSHAGLLPLRMRRWASKVSGETEQSIGAALDVLVSQRFVLVDHETEELVVRTFIRNDGVYKQPKVMLRMREDAQLIESPTLRRAFLVELDRLPLDELSDLPTGKHGDLPSTRETVAAVVDTLRRDFRMTTAGVSDTPADGYAEPLTQSAHSESRGDHAAESSQVDTPNEGYREGSAVPPRVRAGALPHPPTPSPQPPATVPPTAGAVASSAPTAQTLIAEWIDHCDGKRPPGQVIGQVAKHLGQMLDEGIPIEHVRAGLAAWHDKRLHPSALPSVVHEVRQGPRTAARKGSTTDDRVRQGLDLARHFADLDSQQLAIEGRQ